MNIEKLSYYLLPARNPNVQFKLVHDKIFSFWLDIWSKVFRDLNFDTQNLIDDFIRQDAIAAITYDGEIVSTHLYSFLCIDSLACQSHRYFSGNYSKNFFNILRDQGVNTVLSLEYLTVDPKFRKHFAEIHMGGVMAALSTKVLQFSNCDASIAPARRDHKVHELAYALGGECIEENITNHNVACDLIAIRKSKVLPYPDININRVANYLWQNRISTLSFYEKLENKYFEEQKNNLAA